MINQLTEIKVPYISENQKTSKKPRKPYTRSVYPGIPSGNPIISSLYDESQRRGSSIKQMAAELGVTYGYINQLRYGMRKTELITQKMAEAIARYLSIPTISVKLGTGMIKISDFDNPAETEDAAIERLITKITKDKDYFRIPMDLSSLSLSAKKKIIMNYAESSTNDVLGLSALSIIANGLHHVAKVHANLTLEKPIKLTADFELHNFFRTANPL